jgi:hypothetical protein
MLGEVLGVAHCCILMQGLVFNYYVDEATCMMVPWEDKVPGFQYFPDDFSNLFVPTVETTRLTYFLDSLVNNKHYVMFVGNTGVIAYSLPYNNKHSVMFVGHTGVVA